MGKKLCVIFAWISFCVFIFQSSGTRKVKEPPDFFCPKWEVSPDMTGETTCKKVSSIPDFNVQLCSSPLFCGARGFFLVERLDKQFCNDSFLVSRNEKLDALYKNEFGPDSWYMIFNGPQRFVPQWKYLGNCITKLSFRLFNPGNYSVNLMLAFTNFSAVNEVDDVFPLPNATFVFKNLEMPVCNQCPKITDHNLQSMSLPLCDVNVPTQGIYLQMGSPMTMRELYKFKNYNISYIWVPVGCKYGSVFENNVDDKCFETNRSVKFIGDSQLRQTFFLLDRRLVGNGEALDRSEKDNVFTSRVFYYGSNNEVNVSNTSVLPHQSLALASNPHFTMTFSFEAFLHSFVHDESAGINVNDEEFDKYDTLLFDAGHWHFAGERQGGHWTIDRYLHWLEYIMDVIDDYNRRRLRRGMKKWRVIWAGVYSFYICETVELCGYYLTDKNWRTPHRLQVANNLSNDLMKRRGALVIDSSSITLPWIQESPDRAHFQTLPALDALVDEFLHKIDMCQK